MLNKTNKESLVKALATDLGLGGKYAEQLCEISGIDKNHLPQDVKNIDKLFSSIKKLKLELPKQHETLNQYLDEQFNQE